MCACVCVLLSAFFTPLVFSDSSMFNEPSSLSCTHHSPPPTTNNDDNSLPLTEDVCFLCKEGGDLVECDEGTCWSRKVKAKHASLGNPSPLPGTAYSCCGTPEEDGEKGKEAGKGGGGEFTQCRKVYHAYCMGFFIGDDELGSCPRHACQECGEVARRFCRYVGRGAGGGDLYARLCCWRVN